MRRRWRRRGKEVPECERARARRRVLGPGIPILLATLVPAAKGAEAETALALALTLALKLALARSRA